jgi:hypothetical protein
MNRIFTYEEAASLLTAVQQLTAAAMAELERLGQTDAPAESEDLTAAAEAVFDKWAASVRELGVEVKGLWLVDFDCGSGYYCWKYPEPALQHFHGHDEGFTGRVKLN